MRNRKSLFIGVFVLILSQVVLANHQVSSSKDMWEPRAYVGLQGGYAMTHLDNLEKLEGDFLGYSDISNFDGFTGRIYFGYDLYKNIAIEAGYSYLFNRPYAILEESGERSNLCGNTWAIDLVGVMKVNISDKFGLFTKLGVNYLQNNHGDDDFDEVHNFNLTYGAGVFYDISKNVSIDISWLRHNGNEKISENYQPSIDKFIVGVKYKFLT